MKRHMAFSLSLFLVAGGLSRAADSSSVPYCPPGAKFCPAPGADNTVYLDTHFGVDAQTGEITAYKGTVHPNEVDNGPGTGEMVLYTAPQISVENRYVPYPGAAPQPPPAAFGQTQPVYAQPRTQYASAQQPRAAAAPARETRSEVANQQAARTADRKEQTRGEDRVPWWKGGMWRNRKSDKPDSSGSSSASSSSRSQQPAALSADDMWDDNEYTGYNPDGTYGGGIAGGAQGNPYADPFAAPQQSFSDPYSQQGFADPYSQPQYASDPFAQPQYGVVSQGTTAGGFVGDPYTMPNSPPPSSPYQAGYTYPGTNLSYDSMNSGYATTEYVPPAPGGASTYTAQPQVYTAQPDASFLPPPPSAAAPSFQASLPAAPAATGSPQFENAVRMVKENRFTEAKSILVAETSTNMSNAAAWRWLADCHYNLLELDQAITAYQRAISLDPNDYYATRGQGFSHLHRGHELWRQMQEEVARGQKEQAAATFSQAHEHYKKSLDLLGACLRRAPNDGEAIYGEAMAAEGASRKLYSNAVSYLKLGPENRERAELFAENCLTVINKGIERANDRAKQNPGESGPRALLGGLYLRKAILYRQLGKNDLALIELKNSHDVQQSILDEIDKNNASAIKGVRECENYWRDWGGAS